MAHDDQQRTAGAPRRRPRWRSCLVLLLALFLLAELAVQGLLTLEPWDRPLFSTPVGFFYPELRDLPPRREGELHVLVLGASVLAPGWSGVVEALEARLRAELGEVRVVNLARAGHTSLDSLYKYRLLAGRRFDAVLVYHGINDARANNCPPERFERDYSQYLWYRAEASVLPPPDELFAEQPARLFVLPTALRYAGLHAAAAAGWVRFVPPGEPDADWLVHGSEIKTAATLRANVQGVLGIAAARDEPVVLMAFASWQPPGYTLDEFRAGRLGYSGRAGLATELWGRPADVVAAIAAHNRELEALAAQADPARVRWLDMRPIERLGGAAFRDVCHLSAGGGAAFVERLAPVVVEVLNGRRGSR